MRAPPKLALMLLKASVPVHNRDAILGDFAEEYERLCLQKSTSIARAWYWQQTYTSLPHFLAKLLQSSSIVMTIATIFIGAAFFFACRELGFYLFRLVYTTNIFHGSIVWALVVRFTVELSAYVLAGGVFQVAMHIIAKEKRSPHYRTLLALSLILITPPVFSIMHGLSDVMMRYNIALILSSVPVIFFGARVVRNWQHKYR